jgi:hypothetical protein
VTYGKGKCRALDADDFRWAEKLLKVAVIPATTKSSRLGDADRRAE